MLGAIDLVRVDQRGVTRDITVACVDAEHGERVVNAVRALDGVNVLSVSDRTFLMHKGGKIEIAQGRDQDPRRPLDGLHAGRRARLDGDRRRSRAAWTLTIRGHTVAVVSDGTAVLGLGDIGPEAAMPVMEGKAMLFKELAGVDAFPLCLNTTDVDEIVAHRRGRRADLRRHQPRGHRGAALLRDRAAAEGVARHPGLPRRPARHRGRRAGGAAQRAAVVGKHGGATSAWSSSAPARRDGVREDHPRARRPATSWSATSAASCTRTDRTWRASWPRWPRARTRAGSRGPPTTRWPAPTWSSACPPRARSPPRPCARWPTTRSSSRWPTRRPRSSPRSSGRTSRSWPRAAATTRTRSTTCSPSRASSAARSTCARAASTRR